VPGVQEKEPLLGMESARVLMAFTFVEGPRRRTRETGPVVVGSHLMV
jgi:hypothetical protein